MATVNGSMLRWAREAAGLNLELAAKRAGFKDTKKTTAEGKLRAMENMERNELSVAKLEKLAAIYRIPVLTFYLPEPPRKSDVGQDFRVISGADPQQNALVQALLRQMKASQSIIKEALLEADATYHLPFVGSMNVDLAPKTAARKISDAIHFDIKAFRQARNSNEAFKYLRAATEKLGIYVILKGNLKSHHTNIDIEYFRGIAIADNVAPFIVINDLDQSSAYSFTLLHELAHLFMGQGGISNNSIQIKVEKICNEIASQILLPDDDFAKFAINKDISLAAIERLIADYSTLTNVSCTHIAYRLLSRGDLDASQYKQLSRKFLEYWRAAKAKEKTANRDKPGGPNYYVVAKYKLGALVAQVEQLTRSGILSPSKAGIATNVRPINIYNLFDAA